MASSIPGVSVSHRPFKPEVFEKAQQQGEDYAKVYHLQELLEAENKRQEEAEEKQKSRWQKCIAKCKFRYGYGGGVAGRSAENHSVQTAGSRFNGRCWFLLTQPCSLVLFALIYGVILSTMLLVDGCVLLPRVGGFCSWIHLLIYHALLFLVVLCHVRCACTNPGTVAKHVEADFLRLVRKHFDGLQESVLNDALAQVTSDEARERVRERSKRLPPYFPEGNRKWWCTKCDNYKPLHAHHCSSCKCCVLAMDHHCPWMNNCVGWRTHKYFFLFVSYASVASLWSAFILVVGFFKLPPGFSYNVVLNKYGTKLNPSGSYEHVLSAEALYASLGVQIWCVLQCVVLCSCVVFCFLVIVEQSETLHDGYGTVERLQLKARYGRRRRRPGRGRCGCFWTCKSLPNMMGERPSLRWLLPCAPGRRKFVMLKKEELFFNPEHDKNKKEADNDSGTASVMPEPKKIATRDVRNSTRSQKDESCSHSSKDVQPSGKTSVIDYSKWDKLKEETDDEEQKEVEKKSKPKTEEKQAQSTCTKRRLWWWFYAAVVAFVVSLLNPGWKSHKRQYFAWRQTQVVDSKSVLFWNLWFCTICWVGNHTFLGLFCTWWEIPQVSLLDGHEEMLSYVVLGICAFGQVFPAILTRHCVLSTAGLSEGRYWTLVTSQLAHGKLEHLLLNLLLIYTALPAMCEKLGHARFYVLFFLGGGGGMLLSLFVRPFIFKGQPAVECAGAGASLFAAIGYLLGIGVSVPVEWIGNTWNLEAFTFMQILLFSALGSAGVRYLDITSHIFGVVAGVMLGACGVLGFTEV